MDEADQPKIKKIVKADRPCLVRYLQMDELACFAPGMLALGVEGASEENAKKYLDLAKEVSYLSLLGFWISDSVRQLQPSSQAYCSFVAQTPSKTLRCM